VVSRGDVIRAYWLVLGRDPDSEDAIRDWMLVRSLPDVVYAFLSSDEFNRFSYLQKARGFAGAASLVEQR